MERAEMSEIRKEIKQYIDKADDKTVRMIHAMLEVDAETNWWETMPESIKADVQTALSQADSDNIISHDQVKKKYPQWFTR